MMTMNNNNKVSSALLENSRQTGRSQDRRGVDNPLSAAIVQCHRALWVLVGFSFFINLLVLTTPVYMMQVFDRVLSSGHTETLLLLTLIAALALLVWGVLEVVRERYLIRMGSWLNDQLSPHFLSAGMQGSLAGLEANTQPLKDLNGLRRFYSGQAVKALVDAVWVPLFLFVLWALHPLIGLTGFVVAVVLLSLAALNEYLSRDEMKKISAARIKNSADADLAVRNADIVQAMGMFDSIVSRWSSRNDRLREMQNRSMAISSSLAGVSRTVRMLAQMIVLGVGAWLVLQQEMTPGSMIAASILMARALAPVEQIVGAWKSLVDYRQARARLAIASSLVPVDTGKTRLPVPQGQVSCEEVTFLPKGSTRPILSSVSFDTEPGRVVGVIGPSAAGKTTLCKLLVGSWRPTTGHVRLDGASLQQWDNNQLGRHVGYLPQRVQLFAGTITENIARMQVDPNEAEVIAAAKLAGAHDMIVKLPDGYNTLVGPDGAFLSGGQRQRIGMARAFFGQPCLLVLDEPNANLDTYGEQALQGALKKARDWGATIFIVTHEPALLVEVDDVLLLNAGKVLTYGPRQSVMTKKKPVSRQAAPVADLPAERPSGNPEHPRSAPVTAGQASGGFQAGSRRPQLPPTTNAAARTVQSKTPAGVARQVSAAPLKTRQVGPSTQRRQGAPKAMSVQTVQAPIARPVFNKKSGRG